MSVNKPLITIATIAALSLLSAGSAMAGEFMDEPAPLMSTLGRAAVQADFLAARNAGQLLAAGEGLAAGKTMVLASAGRDRAAVIAELQAARAAGTLMAAGEGLAADHMAARRHQQAGRTLAQGTRPVTQ